MAIKWISSTDFERDGTSQAGRSLAALSPEYVRVDERKIEDFIEFARAYGKTLRYFNANNQPDGDFGDFIGSLSARDVAAFLEQPEAFDPDRHHALFRPHFTLFAVFLKLLQHAQGQLNGLTRRHLDYHFRRYLQMQPRPAVPDRVNLLFSLAEREAHALVPAGTLVSAGVDVQGKERLYKTETKLVVNRAQIEKLSSVFIERDLFGVVQMWGKYRNNDKDGRFEILRIAYGRPLPGDPLPDYETTKLDTKEAVDTLLGSSKILVQFCQTNLHLSLTDLRIAMSKTPRQVRGVTIEPGVLSIPGFPTVTNLDTYWQALLAIEDYFAMPIESFKELVEKIMVAGNVWDAAYATDAPRVAALLDNAHHDKLRSERRAELKSLRESKIANFAYSAILQQTLYGQIDELKGAAFVPDFEDALRTYLTEGDAKTLHEAANTSSWDIVLNLLAHAMTLRIGKTPPRKTLWRNLVPAENAHTVLAKRSKPDAEGNQPFATFGAAQSSTEATSILGFALTSPILELAEGVRTVTVTLGLRAAGYDFENLKMVVAANLGKVDTLGRNLSPLAVEVSTTKGWLRVKLDTVSSKFGVYDTLTGVASTWGDHANAPGLQLTFSLAEGDPAVVALSNPPDGLDTRYPALRILMQPVWNATEQRYVTYYRELTSLFVGAVHVKVRVSGLLPRAIENDESILDPKKPLEPFGSIPAVGSRLSFGHPEIATKKIDRVKLSYQWLEVPADLSAHYANYGITLPFKSSVRWFDITGPKDLAAGKPLFGTSTGAVTEMDVPVSAPLSVDYASVTKNSFTGRVKTWRRYLQWQLEAPHFQHREYPAKAAEMALMLTIDLANPNVNKTTLAVSSYQVKPPYTPKLAYLKLDYDSSVEVLLFPKTAGDRLDRTYHVHPFGVAERCASNGSEELPLLPRYDAESELCIGLSGVSLPETVTILFRLDEGSADRDIEAPVVTWSQLSGNRWIPLGHRVLRDETRGLQTSGVVALSLDRALPSTMLPAHLTWVRASISQDHASICDTRALLTQAVLATFEERGNAAEHYQAPLPAGAVATLKSPIAGIVGLAQPDPSFGGRPAEDEGMFSTRVSERLRHKQRALSVWDYERIVLDAFPQIFKAKCIPMPEDEPGRVDVLVLPDVRKLPTNELGPKAPIALLSEIEGHLRARVPASASVNVRNATFRAVRLRLGVRFTEVGNDGYWMGRLNEELNRFLSPWAYDEGVDIAVGGRIHASSIVDFVDRCEYVDYIAGVSLFYTDDEGERFTFLRRPADTDADKSYAVESGGPVSVLVAYPQHHIDLITTEHYDGRSYQGVGYMEMEMDFVVG